MLIDIGDEEEGEGSFVAVRDGADAIIYMHGAETDAMIRRREDDGRSGKGYEFGN